MNVGSPTLGGNAIPGDPAGLDTLAARLRSTTEALQRAAGALPSNGLEGWWGGQASDTFRGALAELPSQINTLGSAFDRAAGGISAFAVSLQDFQAAAARLQRQLQQNIDELGSAETRLRGTLQQVAADRVARDSAVGPSRATAQHALDAAVVNLRRAEAAVDNIKAENLALERQAEANSVAYHAAADRLCTILVPISTWSHARNFVGNAAPGVARALGHVQTATTALQEALSPFIGVPGVAEALFALGAFSTVISADQAATDAVLLSEHQATAQQVWADLETVSLSALMAKFPDSSQHLPRLKASLASFATVTTETGLGMANNALMTMPQNTSASRKGSSSGLPEPNVLSLLSPKAGTPGHMLTHPASQTPATHAKPAPHSAVPDGPSPDAPGNPSNLLPGIGPFPFTDL